MPLQIKYVWNVVNNNLYAVWFAWSSELEHRHVVINILGPKILNSIEWTTT